MVLGSHVIISAYGFWLPNDPRGSWSECVGSWELARFGPATKVDTRRSVARRPHNHALRRAAKRALKYSPVRFTGTQARAIGRGFAEFTTKSGLIIWACSILPEHIHLVIARHRYAVEQVVNQVKASATRRLIHEDLHPHAAFATRTGRLPKAFARGHWKVFLDSESDIQRAIRYVQTNPVKDGKRPQKWSFVTDFDPGALPYRVAAKRT